MLATIDKQQYRSLKKGQAVVVVHSDFIRFKKHVLFCYSAIVLLALILVGMTQHHLNQVNKTNQLLGSVNQLTIERDELILKNIQLKEITKPIQEKIYRGGSYIHKTYGIPKEVAMEYSRNIMAGSIRTGLPFSVGLAVPAQESGFRADAVSYTGCCYGQWQIHFRIWSKEKPGLTLEELYDPVVNTRIGYDILKQYYDQTGSLTGALERYYGSTVPEDNIAYSEQVIRRSQEISRYLQS